MLNVNRLSLFYGKIQVLWDVSLAIAEKEMVAVIGSNASGKTSLLNTISGLLTPSSGTVEFLGRAIEKMPAYLIARLGISHIPEGGGLFPDMKVSENLELGAYIHCRGEREKGNHAVGLRDLPVLGGEVRPAGENPQRRGAADAGHRARSHVKTETVHAG